MKHIFIINPAAGKGYALDKLEEKIKSTATLLCADVEIYYSKSVGDAELFVRKSCTESGGETIRFYACGGDGTVNEVFNGTVGFDGAQVGVVPIGTGNDFVKNFGPIEPFFDIEAQIKGDVLPIDGMKLGDKYAVNLVNLGFDCAVVETVARIKRRSWVSSKMAYIAGVAIEFMKMPGAKLKELVIDGKRIDKKELQLCAFANGSFYGGGFHCAPLASTNDGIIDICLVNPVTRFQFATMIGDYKKGTYLENKRIMKLVEYHKCKEVSIEFEGETSVCVDGEITRVSKLDIKILPSAFRLVIPSRISDESKNEKEMAGNV